LEVKEWTLAPEDRAIRQLLIQLRLAGSGSEADQKLKQGAVSIDDRRVAGPFALQREYLTPGREHVLKIGRRAYLLRVR
jgi:hypothetical protein